MTREITPIERFKSQITASQAQDVLANQLPSDVDSERFTSVVIRAVQEDPDLLGADRRSLLLAAQRAAQDGLIPDKRQGAFVVYNKKLESGQWGQFVQWQPMIGGIRKLLAKHGFDLRSELVYEEDYFDVELGDEPSLTHKPARLGTARGELIGAYAIATGPDGRKYREVMNIEQLEFVRSLSKSSNGPWVKFTDEMYRKTVSKRLFKSLPIPDEDDRLHGAIRRDNEQYDHDESSSDAAKEIQTEARAPTKKKAKSRLPKPITAAPSEEKKPKPSKKKTKKKTAKKKEAPKDSSEEEEVPTPPPSEAPHPVEGELLGPEEGDPLF